MAELVQKGLDIEKGIKEKHMDQIGDSVLQFCGSKVSITQV